MYEKNWIQTSLLTFEILENGHKSFEESENESSIESEDNEESEESEDEQPVETPQEIQEKLKSLSEFAIILRFFDLFKKTVSLNEVTGEVKYFKL